MGTEIEHKWLVDPDWKPTQDISTSIQEIKQGYISDDPNRIVRVRLSELVFSKDLITPARMAFVTIKGRKEGLSAREWEWPIPYESGEELLDQIVRPETVIEKTRYVIRIPLNEGFLYEVDVFKGRLDGLVVAELEVPTVDSSFRVAPWLRKNVTDDRRFANSYLGKASAAEIGELITMCKSGEY